MSDRRQTYETNKLIKDLARQYTFDPKRKKRNTDLPVECGENAFEAMQIAIRKLLTEQRESGNSDMNDVNVNDIFPEVRNKER